jgi:hypothetical protein
MWQQWKRTVLYSKKTVQKRKAQKIVFPQKKNSKKQTEEQKNGLF